MESMSPNNQNQEESVNLQLFQCSRKVLTNLPRSTIFEAFCKIHSIRQELICYSLHIIVSSIIWLHFSIVKHRKLEEELNTNDIHYGWKLYGPTILYGCKHAILFQMTILPLTMCRLTIAKLGRYDLFCRIFPLDRILHYHIFIGYIMIFLTTFAGCLFLTYYGNLCAYDDEDYCDGLASEIMITGYYIMTGLALIGILSYARESISYEVFYAVHHGIFIVYGLTALHTYDHLQRSGERDRSQALQWFVVSFVYYICDRLSMHLNYKYATKLSKALLSYDNDLTNSKKIKMYENAVIRLTLEKPLRFDFSPGQYAYLRIPIIDNRNWHPFSIASSTKSDELEFIIAVCGDESSWTSKLFKLIEKSQDRQCQFSNRHMIKFDVQVMGPCGTSSGNLTEYSHVVAAGTGTGIVPMLSLFRLHMDALMITDPIVYDVNEKDRRNKVNAMYELSSEINKSIYQLIKKKTENMFKSDSELESCKLRDTSFHGASTMNTNEFLSSRSIQTSNIARIDSFHNHSAESSGKDSNDDFNKFHEYLSVYDNVECKAKAQMKVVYYHALVCFAAILGVSLLTISTSVSNLKNANIEISDGRVVSIEINHLFEVILSIGMFLFGCIFILNTVFLQKGCDLYTLIDMVISVMMIVAPCFFWSRENFWNNLDETTTVAYRVLVLYMSMRSWFTATSIHSDFFHTIPADLRPPALQNFHLLWIVRSSSLVSKLLPEIIKIWDKLLKKWDEAQILKYCTISIHVTDKDAKRVADLKARFINTAAIRNGWIQLSRPDLQDTFDTCAAERINSQWSYSKTLVTFCGSPVMSKRLHNAILYTDMASLISDNEGHYECDFRSESYGVKKTN